MKTSRRVKLLKKRLNKLDINLIINLYLIVLISLVFVYSATLNKGSSHISKEIVWIGLGTAVFFIFSMIDYKLYSKYSKSIYILCILMLLAVIFFGRESYGAQRWLYIAGFSFQPSELSKLLIVLGLSELLSDRYEKGVRGWSGIFVTGVYVFIPFIMILKQPDLGTSMVLIFLYYSLIFLNNVDLAPFFTLLGLNIVSIPIAYNFLAEYQKNRIRVFLNPESDILGSGWNIIQSKIAVGSGKLIGKGILEGTQNNLRFLPEAHTDFIFSVIAEETGFVGSVVLIGLYLWLIFSILNIGKKVNDLYGELVCYGIATVFFVHAFINIGMVIGIMPVTGLPLLLVSYGGTSFLISFMMLGIVQSIKIFGGE